MQNEARSAAPNVPAIRADSRGLRIRNADDLTAIAQMVVKSNLAPKGLKTVAEVAVAIQTGLELGLQPMQALSSICVINGRPSLYGDGATGLVHASGQVEAWEEWWENESGRIERAPSGKLMGDDVMACCRIRRKGVAMAALGLFSVAEAKHARLWGKSGPWTDYPQRMLMWRARSWAMRDGFSDVLRGLGTYEEQLDVPRDAREAEWTDVAELAPAAAARAEEEQPAQRAPAAATVMITCQACGGSGSVDGDNTCDTCNGSGEVAAPGGEPTW